MKQYEVNGRLWDSFDAYLFDIDGTLLNCADAVHYFAFLDALQALSGREITLEGVTAHGNTDVGILRDALIHAGVDEGEWRSKLPEACQRMGGFVARREADLRAASLPSVCQVLEHLRARGATLGVATGNLKAIGTLKLKAAGLLDYFTVGGWSDEYEFRADVFQGAINLIREVTYPGATICVLGDTPADIHAARANGLPIIALCTGVYAREELLSARPDLCLDSLAGLLQDES